MRQGAFIGTLALLFVLVGCAPRVETEDPNTPTNNLSSPPFQGDIAALQEIPRYRIAANLGANALIMSGWGERRRQFATRWMMWYNESRGERW